LKPYIMPFLLVLSLLGGLLSSLADVQSLGLTESDLNALVEYLLIIFIFVVSVEVGASLTRGTISSLGKDTLLLTASTISGSLAAGLAASLLPGVGLKLSLATSLGMGWYTLTGPLVAASLGTLAGAVAFFSNFIRELFTFFAYPLLKGRLGARNSIALGGATTMDTTLTVVAAAAGRETAALSFMHGALVSILVPLLVSLALALVP
jgi:uncharacterized membrane protein YbjE (DUF340 family)